MKKTEPERSKASKLENDPRYPDFAKFYAQTSSARKAARLAGYDAAYAAAHAYELARRVELQIGRALREQGEDNVQLAAFLKQKRRAKCTKIMWNPEAKRFEKFVLVDHATQLKAAEFELRCLDAFPSTKHEGVQGGQPVRVVIESSIPRPDRGSKQVQ